MTLSRITKSAPTAPVRCAGYTRKSTEEGLDQDFNSLDAQREAAEAYIHSQAHAGWTCLDTRYDDGGYSGSNLDRPALQRLLADIQTGQIECVLTHRVDRLSRSLLDFARLMETFEQHQVAFESVTQHFNSATSMGRLVLNVLVLKHLAGLAVLRQVDTSGSVSIYNKTYYAGGCYTGTTVYISVDPLRREWLFRDAQGKHVRTQPAKQPCRERFVQLRVSDRRQRSPRQNRCRD